MALTSPLTRKLDLNIEGGEHTDQEKCFFVLLCSQIWQTVEETPQGSQGMTTASNVLHQVLKAEGNTL